MAQPLCKGIYTQRLDYTSGHYTYLRCRLWLSFSIYGQYLQDERCNQHMIVPSAIACNQASFTHVKDIVTAIPWCVMKAQGMQLDTQLLAWFDCYRNTVYWSLIPLRLGLRSTPYSCHGHTLNNPSRPGWTVVCQSFNSVAGTSWQVIAYQWTITLTPLPVSLTPTTYLRR
jgi:hypothetical protein